MNFYTNASGIMPQKPFWLPITFKKRLARRILLLKRYLTSQPDGPALLSVLFRRVLARYYIGSCAILACCSIADDSTIMRSYTSLETTKSSIGNNLSYKLVTLCHDPKNLPTNMIRCNSELRERDCG
jgi:hypothetical protein